MNNDQHSKLMAAVQLASEHWKNAFNQGNAAACAACYEDDAIMHAKPFGTFKGSKEICGFWQQLINDGFSDVEYVEPQLEVVDENSMELRSGWKMNNASGVIHKELWVLQADGTAKLREDDFEAM